MKKLIALAVIIAVGVVLVKNVHNIKNGLREAEKEARVETFKNNPQLLRREMATQVEAARARLNESRETYFNNEYNLKGQREVLGKMDENLKAFASAYNKAKAKVSPDATFTFALKKYTLDEGEKQAQSWVKEYVSKERIVNKGDETLQIHADLVAQAEEELASAEQALAEFDHWYAEKKAELLNQEARQRAIEAGVYDENKASSTARKSEGQKRIEDFIADLKKQNDRQAFIKGKMAKTRTLSLEEVSTKEAAPEPQEDNRADELFDELFGIK